MLACLGGKRAPKLPPVSLSFPYGFICSTSTTSSTSTSPTEPLSVSSDGSLVSTDTVMTQVDAELRRIASRKSNIERFCSENGEHMFNMRAE